MNVCKADLIFKSVSKDATGFSEVPQILASSTTVKLQYSAIFLQWQVDFTRL